MSIELFVQVLPLQFPDRRHPEDREIHGTYRITVEEDGSPGRVAAAALDGFHSTIPVERPKDFLFQVHTAQGDVWAEDPDHPAYSAASLCGPVRKEQHGFDERTFAVGTRILTEDGYTLERQPDGTWSDGDLVFASLDGLEVDFVFLRRKELADAGRGV